MMELNRIGSPRFQYLHHSQFAVLDIGVQGIPCDPTTHHDHRHAWILVLEKLKNMELMDTADDVSGWRRTHIETAVRGIAEIHAIWYRRERELMAQPWLGSVFTAAGMAEINETLNGLSTDLRKKLLTEFLNALFAPSQN